MKTGRRSILSMLDDTIRWTGMPARVAAQLSDDPDNKRGPLRWVPIGPIAFAPYQLPLGRVSGKLALDITAYGNRVNAFGPVHNSDEHLKGAGPPAWHTSGPHWSDEHQLRPTGIVQAPILHAKQ